MKTILSHLLSATVLCLVIFSFAESYAQTRGFEAGVDFFGGIGLSRFTYPFAYFNDETKGPYAVSRNVYGAEAVGGWRFNEHLFIGAGVGFQSVDMIATYGVTDRKPYDILSFAVFCTNNS